MHKVLITGSSGFLGTILKKCFINDAVFELNRNTGDYHCTLEKELPDFQEAFDLIIHSAGKAHSVPKTDVEKQAFFNVNVSGTVNLLKGLEKSGSPKQFVFISSVSVYGLESGINITENSPLLAKDPYGKSKIEAEEVVQEWCDKNQVVCTILRLPLLVGTNPPGNLGAMLKAIEKGYYFNIGGGVARKSMVLALDVARFIPLVAPIGGVYNLTDGMHPNFKELSSTIAKSKNKSKPLNLTLNSAKFLGKFGDIIGSKFPVNSLKVTKICSELTFDDTKARNIQNWKPQPILEYLEDNNL